MSLIVPFDGSELSKMALIRATQFDMVVDQGVVAVSVIPKSASYARERGWIAPNESYDGEKIVDGLRDSVMRISPDAEYNHISVDRNAGSGLIANTIRKFARQHNATIVFVGSNNAGKVAKSISVGSSVTSDQSYDTMIVCGLASTQAESVEDLLPVEKPTA